MSDRDDLTRMERAYLQHQRLLTVDRIEQAILGRTATDAARRIEQIIGQAVEEALTGGPLPDGWERSKQAHWGAVENPDDPPQRWLRALEERTVILGPWKEIGDE